MDNEELGRRVRKIYNEYNKMMVKQGYDEVSLDDFLEWIEDMVKSPYDEPDADVNFARAWKASH